MKIVTQTSTSSSHWCEEMGQGERVVRTESPYCVFHTDKSYVRDQVAVMAEGGGSGGRGNQALLAGCAMQQQLS